MRPYFALRSYRDGGEHYAGQLGSEATPAEFVDALIDCTREMVRVVKPSGSIWINLGDKYSSGSSGDRNTGFNIRWGNSPGRKKQERSQLGSRPVPGMQPKSLLGIPWRYALRCIDDLGLILRAEVIWSKPNGLPESVTDRVRRSHEQWFHFTLQPRYYSAVDEIREGYARKYSLRDATTRATRMARDAEAHINRLANAATRDPDDVTLPNLLGKLPGSVWTIPTEPLRVPDHLGVDHFAAFPSEWPKRIIRGWSPAGVCTACGEGRRPVSHNEITGDRGGRQFNPASGNVGVLGKERVYEITDYVCACDPDRCRVCKHTTTSCRPGVIRCCDSCTHGHAAPTVPALILDPFGGTGTVAMVARALGRHGIHADLSADYNRLARWRITDLDQLAHVQGHERTKREPDTDDLLTLLDDGGAA